MSDSMRSGRRDDPDETQLRELAEALVSYWDGMPGVTERTYRAITDSIIALDRWLAGETDGNQDTTQSSVFNRGSEAQEKHSPLAAPPASSPETIEKDQP